MYIKLSEPVIQDKPTTDKPDLAMMLRAYELFLYGFREGDIVGFGQHYAGKNFKYLNYEDFRENLDELVEWQTNSDLPNACFLANPIRDNYEQTKGETTTSPTSKETDFVRVCWYLLDLDRVEALKYPAGSKDYSPATPAELTMLAKANKALMDFLDGIGFACILNHHSGNGYGLAIPVHFANGKEVKRKFLEMNKIIQDALADFPEVEIDNGFASPRQPWSIPGSLNRKAGRSTLRLALNYNQFTPDDLANARESNTMCLEAHLAEAQILVANDYQPKGKLSFPETISGNQTEMLDFLTQWDNDNCLKEMLVDHGYQLVKDFGHKAFLKRPGKDGPGHGLVVGGQKNRVWNWSSSDETFPQNQSIKPYWAYLLLKGIAKDGKVINTEGANAFYREVAEKYRQPFTLRDRFKANTVEADYTPAQPATRPAALVPVEVKQEPRQTTGTLACEPMPGVIEQIAQDIGLRNPKVSPAIDRAIALGLFQLMIGKSRVHESGTYCNSWIVNLAPSSAGKEAGKLYAQRFMNQVAEAFEQSKLMPIIPSRCFGYKIIGVNGANGGSPQGIEDELLINGRVFLFGDESEKFIHPEAKNDRAIGIRDLLLGAYSKGMVIGRALSGGLTRPTVTNCFVGQCHTTQPKSYFEAFTNDNDFKGSIGRYIHFEANKGLPRFGIKDSAINQDLIQQGLYWQAENLRGLDRIIEGIKGTIGKDQIPFLGRFKPPGQLTMSYCKQIDGESGRVHQYRIYCDEQAAKASIVNNGLLERFWDKLAENALRLAMTYSAAVDRESPTITDQAWDLATKHLEGSKQVLVSNRGDILKSAGEAKEEALMSHIKDCWSKGELLTVNELYLKFRGKYRQGEASGKKEFDDSLALLHDLRQIRVNPIPNQPGRHSYRIDPYTREAQS